DRPVAGLANALHDRIGEADGDRLLPQAEGLEAVRGLVPVSFDPLDESVRCVAVRGRQAPGDVRVAPEYVERHAGRGRAGHGELRRVDAGEIPDVRKREAEMRVVRQNRRAGLRTGTGDDPT